MADNTHLFDKDLMDLFLKQYSMNEENYTENVVYTYNDIASVNTRY